MKTRASYTFFLIAILLAFFSRPANGQVATGDFPFASLGGGPFDQVNLANLNFHFDIPVVSKAGRGLSFSYSVTYNGAVWFPVNSGGTVVWQSTANFGWSGAAQNTLGYITYLSGQDRCFIGGQFVFVPIYNAFGYVDPSGARHSFPVGIVGGCNESSGNFPATATDGSGLTILSMSSISTTSGSMINPPVNASTGSGTISDRNGNEITTSGSTFTDTLGNTVLTVVGQGTASSPLQLQYTSPQSTTVAVKLNYTNQTVKTNFGCSGVSEYGPTQVPLVSSVSLPDGTSYQIVYETTPGFSGDVTGRIKSITLPTGGTITYSYSGGSNGIVCTDGTIATLNRQTPDGTWVYAHSESGAAWTTNISDPQGNSTVINFQQNYETERQIYQGSSTLLKSVYTCYNAAAPPCNSVAITLPITEKAVYPHWLAPGNLESAVATFYDSTYGRPTEKDEYAYGPAAPGAIIRKTLWSYASLTNNIVSMPAQITVEDGSNNIKAQAIYCYDEGTPSGTTTCAATGAPTATSGTPQHVSVTGSRGNATTINYLVSGSTYVAKKFTYYDTGTVNAATDLNGGQTTYTYGSGSCGNSFVTSISEPLSLSRSMTWNCTGGVNLSVTDENAKTSSTTYSDSFFWRPGTTTDNASDVTTFTYTGANQVDGAMLFNSNASTLDYLVTLDGLGRIELFQQKEGPNSTTYDSIETDYDSNGRTYRTTLPFAGPNGQKTSPTGPGKTTAYDGLGRKTQVQDNDGLNLTFSYSQNDTYRTLGPQPTGENTKRKQLEYDSLRRITSVCEVTTATGSGACGQTTAANGYWTTYAYDALGNLTGTTQNAQSSSKQSRVYSYDGLSRMTSETNPESGTTTYTYDSDSTCPTSKGDLVKKVDAMGNVTCFTYDQLHRLTTTSVSSGPYAATTPNKVFVYDGATVNGISMGNVKGNLAEAYTCVSPCTTKITDVGLSYTALGQPSDVYESMPHSGPYYHVTASYWASGVLHQLSNLAGLPIMTYGVDAEGRMYSVSASTGQNPTLSTNYNVASQPTQINLGSSDSDTFTYDQNSNRMTKYQFSMNGQSIVGQLTWNPIGTLKQLVITDPFFGGGNQTCTYTHDDISRIASANCGSGFSQTFSYSADGVGALGNLSKSGSSSFQPTYSYLTNHMTLIGSSTPTYDLDGNVTNDFLHIYTWDASGRPTSVDGVGLTYDALGRVVEQNRNNVYTEVVYSPNGGKFALMNGQTLQKAFVPLPGASAAVYNTGGLAYYRHSDWLGSSRFASTPTRTMYFDGAYAPFGEPYAESGTADLSFTGMNQDTTANLYDFPAREYGIQGRWPSPDPAGLSAATLSDPQTLNRYAYVRNNPLHLVDPTGTVECDPTVESCESGGGIEGFGCPINICGPPLWQDGSIGDQPGGGGGALPGQLPGGADPFDPFLSPQGWSNSLIGCINAQGQPVSCIDPTAVTDCDDGATPDGLPTIKVPAACYQAYPLPPSMQPGKPESGLKPISRTMKLIDYGSCVFGTEPEYLKPLETKASKPEDSTDAPDMGKRPGVSEAAKALAEAIEALYAQAAQTARCWANVTTQPSTGKW